MTLIKAYSSVRNDVVADLADTVGMTWPDPAAGSATVAVDQVFFAIAPGGATSPLDNDRIVAGERRTYRKTGENGWIDLGDKAAQVNRDVLRRIGKIDLVLDQVTNTSDAQKVAEGPIADALGAKVAEDVFNGTVAEIAGDIVAQQAAIDSRVPKFLPRAMELGAALALATSAAQGYAAEFPPVPVDDDAPTGYDNLYSPTKYRVALAQRFQMGSAEVPSDKPAPMVVAHKYSSVTGPPSGTPEWDQAAYFGIKAKGNGAFRVAVSAIAEASGSDLVRGDIIGGHRRATVSDGFGARAYGGWDYVNVISPNTQAAHAVEFNGSTIYDLGYGAGTQLLRVCLSDNFTSNNRFATGMQFGRVSGNFTDPSYANNGFYTGIQFDSDSIVRSGATANGGNIAAGEAIRINHPSGYGVVPAGQYVGGMRFARPSVINPDLSGAFKYAVATFEAPFYRDRPFVLADGQGIGWGGMSGAVTLLATTIGGSTTAGFARLDGGYLNINPDSSVGIAVQFRGTKVLGPRATGWALPTGLVSRSSFDPASVTLTTLAQIVSALVRDLFNNHGMIGA